jgi:predicted NodU family carbamoyl transferase
VLSDASACLLVDGQVVAAAEEERFRRVKKHHHPLISRFHVITGVPCVLNTSFNESEPIVHTPDEAIDCFL